MPVHKTPLFNMDEQLNIMVGKLVLLVRITKRSFTGDYDKGEVNFLYDFHHINTTVQRPWFWTQVPESVLQDMIHRAKIHIEKTI